MADNPSFDDRWLNNLPEYVSATPVDYDPFERAASRVKQSVKPEGGRTEGVGTDVATKLIPGFIHTLAQPIVEGADTMRRASEGNVTSENPEDIWKTFQSAGVIGAGALPFAERGTLGAAGGRMVQPSEKAPPFYSALENAVANTKQQKMPADQWLGTISNSKGVKPEELDWTGFKDYLAEKGKQPVTKQEVQDFINSNKVELKEVNKGGLPTYTSAPEGTWLATARPNHQINNNPTKYSQYQLPGGENYREMLLTLPEKQYDKTAKINFTPQDEIRYHELSKMIDEKEMQGINDGVTEAPSSWYHELEALQERRAANMNINETLANRARSKEGGNYKSSHWDEPNILAHVRMNDRNIEGKKSLHLEEIQSDWHQQGRDKGYKGQKEVSLGNEGPFAGATGLQQGVPDAPFKKSWHELVLKRMIREASEKGYDRLSWTPGEANRTNPKNLGQTGESAERADRGLKKFYDEIIPQAIEKIGKEHGVKVKEGFGNSYSAQGDFALINKYGHYAKGGATREEAEKSLNNRNKDYPDDEWKIVDSRPKVHYIDIPQSLKDTAVGKGFPLFSAGLPFSFTPVDYNPHETVNNKNHVPYGAGASDTPSGYPVNIDKRIPQHDDKLKLPNGEPADLHKYLTIHEIEEYKAMKAGVPYHKAHHDIATPMEKKAVESDGVDWKMYEHIMNGYLKKTEEEGYKNLPEKLYKKPYHSRTLIEPPPKKEKE